MNRKKNMIMNRYGYTYTRWDDVVYNNLFCMMMNVPGSAR